MNTLETERLALRELASGDAAFVLELLNDPGFIRNIGDRGARTVEDAQRYIAERIVASYKANGFGLYGVVPKGTAALAGICGLVKREGLDRPDIGFAFLERFRGNGYATEAAAVILAHARDTLGLTPLLAITALDNTASIRVLEKIGLRFDRIVRLPNAGRDSRLFTTAAPPQSAHALREHDNNPI
ncbi:MAG TPA: GNAT family N-acetyltransferase [Rhizomicrobium sp.]|nr:GNAT family N-acetyltransferase [Rhizomicrobium sp.]